MITEEQPPIDTEFSLKEYLSRMFRFARLQDSENTRRLDVDDAISLEVAVLRGSTTLTSNILVSYPDSFIPTPDITSKINQLIALDETAGTITIGYAGIYRLSGYVAQSSGTNNSAYAWAVNTSTQGQLILGTQVFTNATNGSVFSASAAIFLPAGEVVDIRTIDTLTGITVASSDLEVSLIGL